MSVAEKTGEVVFAAIVPHGALAVSPSGRDEEPAQARATQQAFLELSGRLQKSGAESVVLFTPHNVHVEGNYAAIGAGKLQGGLKDWGAPGIELNAKVDLALTRGIQQAAHAKGLPLLTVSYGGNNPEESKHPMDWATLIPLWYLGGRGDAPLPVAVVIPARDRPPAEHVTLGEAVADAIRESGKRVAVIASCDHGHGHQADGPYGFRPESAPYDDEVQRLLREDQMEKLLDLDPEFVKKAAADSWWQMLILQGVLGDAWKPDLLSYEHPTYFGMLVAGFAPR